ncbi:phage tail protein, partial [Xanthobacter sp. DSM 24535]
VPYPARTILFVQQLPTGTATPKSLYRITRKDQGAGLFGAGSVGDDMVRFYKGSNTTGDLYAVGLTDAATGIAATGTITFAGAATLAGPLALYIGSVRIPLAISNGQTAAQAATAAAAAITAVAGLPLTAAAAGAVVTLTARHKGEVGNGYHVAVARQIDDTQPPGLTTTIGAMSGG